MITGFQGVMTGLKKGNYSVEVNTRFPEKMTDLTTMLKDLLLSGRELNCWAIRKVFETTNGYSAALKTLMTV